MVGFKGGHLCNPPYFGGRKAPSPPHPSGQPEGPCGPVTRRTPCSWSLAGSVGLGEAGAVDLPCGCGVCEERSGGCPGAAAAGRAEPGCSNLCCLVLSLEKKANLCVFINSYLQIFEGLLYVLLPNSFSSMLQFFT